MNGSRTLLCLALAALAGSVHSQEAKPAAAAPAAPSAEPRVQQIVIEDEGSRIEELRVRGATQRITVKPKVGTTQGYEIIVGDGSRDLSDGVNTSRGAAGKRVWHLLSF
ncbi:MAG: hypothetical protein QM722_11135 [Piscinibacter sp.]